MAGAPMLILAWRLGDQVFGTQVQNLVHIEPRLQLRRLPAPIPGADSLAFYQGRIVLAVDLAHVLLGKSDYERSPGSMYLIFQTDEQMYAGQVDSVIRIISASTDDLATWREPPDHLASGFVRALLPVDDNTMWLLDMQRMTRHLRDRGAQSVPGELRGA